MTNSKENGGLGIRRLKERNRALLGKWLWRFVVERHSLWQSIIISRYGEDMSGWDCRQILHISHSLMWRNIVQITPHFYSHTRFGLGCRSHVRFWKDLLWGVQTLAVVCLRLYCISSQKESCVTDILSYSLTSLSWNLYFSHDLLVREIPMVAHLLQCLNDIYISSHATNVRETHTSSGQFSVKSFSIMWMKPLLSISGLGNLENHVLKCKLSHGWHSSSE